MFYQKKNVVINLEDEDSEEYLKSRITYLDTMYVCYAFCVDYVHYCTYRYST